MSFKSGKYKNLTYDQIINNGGETLNNLINSKHHAYKKFNEYYQQKKSIQEFIIKRKKNIVKRALKNFINKKRFTKVEENKYDYDDDEKKEEIYINNDFMLDEDQNIIVSIDNKYVFGNQLHQRIYRLLPIPIINNTIFSNVEMITYKLMEIINNFLSEFHNKMDRIAINLILLHGEEIASINLDRNINIENLIMLLVDR